MSTETYPLPITVSIAGESVDWHLRQTRAPKDYDGFGTFCIHEYEGDRLVLIRAEHFNWQTARYASGGFAVVMPEEWQYSEAIELLRKRLYDPTQ
jgi:hypothetical protein